MKYLLTILLLSFFTINLNAQIGINTSTPYKNSILDLKHNAKGLLIPRLNNTQINALKITLDNDTSGEGEGMLIWDTTSHKIFCYNNTKKWQIINPWEQSVVGGDLTTSDVVRMNGSEQITFLGRYLEKTGIVFDDNGIKKDVGLFVSKGIVGDWLGASSDERIKDIIGISNSKDDLSALLSLEVTDYKKKDKIQFGEQITKKLIAQQVKAVYPAAVSFQTDIIPDIYKAAEIKAGYIALKTDLEKGDRVKLIFEDKEEIVEVIKTNRNGFFIDNKKEGKVFVYGKEVDDFHVVDYDAVSMLNVSATQELYKLILKQQQTIENQKTEIKAHTLRLEVIKKNQLDFEARLKSIENRDNITTSNK